MAAQAGSCLAWSETPEDTFSRVVAHILTNVLYKNFYGTAMNVCEAFDGLQTSLD